MQSRMVNNRINQSQCFNGKRMPLREMEFANIGRSSL